MDYLASIKSLLAWTAIGAVFYHGLAIVTLHLLASNVNPFTDMVDAYLQGPYRLLARSTFLAFAFAFGALALGIASVLPSSWLKTGILILLVLAVIGFLSVFILPEASHIITTPTRPATLFAVILLSFAVRDIDYWQPITPFLLGISITLVCLFIFTLVFGTASKINLNGLTNRIVLILLYCWIIIVARSLLRG